MANNYIGFKRVSNLDYLHGLAKGNSYFVKEMIEIFLSDNLEEVQNLEKSIQEKNYLLIKDFAHKMKSSIAFVGLDQLIENELCEIEQLATDKSEIKKIEFLFFKVKEVCLKAAEELTSELEMLQQ